MSSFTAGARRALNAVRRVAQGDMPSFDVDGERINVFDIGEFYVFKHYFEIDEAFNAVRDYYNREEYRFEVPKDQLGEVREKLKDYFFELEVVENAENYCVVKRKYSDHPKLLFRNAVDVRSRGEYNIFVMKNLASVEQAVNHGARRLDESELESNGDIF